MCLNNFIAHYQTHFSTRRPIKPSTTIDGEKVQTLQEKEICIGPTSLVQFELVTVL